MTYRILLAEDSADDAALIARQFQKSGLPVEIHRVSTEPAFEQALAEGTWDIVLSDHVMPRFSSSDVLRILRQRRPDLPCVIVSGRIGEEAAASAIRDGAAGYCPKDHLERLDTTVRRSLREAEDRHARSVAEEALRVSEERYALAVAGANDVVWDWDLATDRFYLSPRWTEVLGLGEDTVDGRPREWLDRIHPDDLERVRSELDLHLAGEVPQFRSEHRLRHRHGSWRWMLVRGVAVLSADGRPTRIAGSMSDITMQKQTEARLAYSALHDALTGLPNRALFMDRLALALHRLERHPTELVAVVFIDLDRFKIINDSLGHARGDELLVRVSRLLESTVGPGNTVARIGGDEFAVLLDELHHEAEALAIVDGAQSQIQRPHHIAGRDVYTSASIGLAITDDPHARPADLLRDADTAMYRAKAAGKARAVVFNEAMHDHAVTLLALETDLRDAIRRQEFRLFYQPVVSLETGKIHGFESLVRWDHPRRGLVSPEDFVGFAKKTGLIVPIGEQVLRDACRQARKWRDQAEHGRPAPVIAVNLSVRQFAQPDLADRIGAELARWGIPGEALDVEITETVLMENYESAAQMLDRLKAMDLRVWLDDFGTGYSSLNYLHRFKVDGLKIDKYFVQRLGAPDDGSKIVGSITALATSMGLSVIAEGVETEAQARALRALQCTYGQGWLFSPPVEAAAATALLTRAPHLRERVP